MIVCSSRLLICTPLNQSAQRLSTTPDTRISYLAGFPETLIPAPASTRPERRRAL